MLSDIVIAQAAKMLPIAKVAEKLGLTDEDLIPYGRYKAKINHKLIHSDRPDGKLILMTAISPTPAGEGKTTTRLCPWKISTCTLPAIFTPLAPQTTCWLP